MLESRFIVIAGGMAQNPRNGGMQWFFLQFLLGFRRLGWNVLLLDRLNENMCVDIAGHPAPFERSINADVFASTLHRFGLDSDTYSLDINNGEGTVGARRPEVLERVNAAPFILNVMGYLDDREILAAAQRRVFFDIDPGFPQMWKVHGLHNAFAGHDNFVTVGRNIGKPDCAIPTCGLKWITLSQPVVLDQWAVAPNVGGDAAFTSIGAWRGHNAPIEYCGKTYGLRCHEFRQFAELPRRCKDSKFEMALDISPADAKDIRLLRENGWSLVDPKEVASDPWAYRQYIVGSRAEFMVPKQMYVATNSGLLSDRSAYYLASGRPVLARDTGIQHLYPTGQGLLTFSTLDEAAAGVAEINGNYDRHAKAAREIAVEYFDSDKVLKGLLAKLDVG